jgi:hypothetical protein
MHLVPVNALAEVSCTRLVHPDRHRMDGSAAVVGLKGIQYVARVATFLPIIPLVVADYGPRNVRRLGGEL